MFDIIMTARGITIEAFGRRRHYKKNNSLKNLIVCIMLFIFNR